MTDVEQADRFEKATTFDGDPEDPQDKMVQDAAKKNSRAGGRDDTKTYGDAAKNISEQAQKNVSGVIKPETVQGREAKGLEGIGPTNRENANKQFGQSGSVVKPPKAPKEKAPETKTEAETPAPGPQGMTNPEFDPEQVEKFKEANKTPAQRDAEAAEKRRDPKSYDPSKVVEAAKDKDRAPGAQTEQPQGEQQPSEEGGLKPESAEEGYENYLNDITDEEWDYTKKMLGDVGVAGMDILANAGEMLNKQYGALTALAGTALSGKPMSIASQAVTSTMTGLAAMNSFVDKTAQRSLGVKPGVSPEKLKDQLTVKGAGWYRDRDRAAAAEKYLTSRFDQAIKDAVGPDGDVSNIDAGQLEMISKRMREDMDPIMTRILAKPKEKRSMEDQAFMNAYQAMGRGIGKMSKQANSNARMVMKQFNQQAKEQSQQVKGLKTQLQDPQFIMESIDKNTIPDNAKLDAYSTLYNHLTQKVQRNVPMTDREQAMYDWFEKTGFKRKAEKAHADKYVTREPKNNRRDFITYYNDALKTVQGAIGRSIAQNGAENAKLELTEDEIAHIRPYLDRLRVDERTGMGQISKEDQLLGDLLSDYWYKTGQLGEDGHDTLQKIANLQAISVPVTESNAKNKPIQTNKPPEGEQNVLEEPKTIESPVNPAADPPVVTAQTPDPVKKPTRKGKKAPGKTPEQIRQEKLNTLAQNAQNSLENPSFLSKGGDEWGVKDYNDITELINHRDSLKAYATDNMNQAKELEALGGDPDLIRNLRDKARIASDRANKESLEYIEAARKKYMNRASDEDLTANYPDDGREAYIADRLEGYGSLKDDDLGLKDDPDALKAQFGEEWDNARAESLKNKEKERIQKLIGDSEEFNKKVQALNKSLPDLLDTPLGADRSLRYLLDTYENDKSTFVNKAVEAIRRQEGQPVSQVAMTALANLYDYYTSDNGKALRKQYKADKEAARAAAEKKSLDAQAALEAKEAEEKAAKQTEAERKIQELSESRAKLTSDEYLQANPGFMREIKDFIDDVKFDSDVSKLKEGAAARLNTLLEQGASPKNINQANNILAKYEYLEKHPELKPTQESEMNKYSETAYNEFIRGYAQKYYDDTLKTGEMTTEQYLQKLEDNAKSIWSDILESLRLRAIDEMATLGKGMKDQLTFQGKNLDLNKLYKKDPNTAKRLMKAQAQLKAIEDIRNGNAKPVLEKLAQEDAEEAKRLTSKTIKKNKAKSGDKTDQSIEELIDELKLDQKKYDSAVLKAGNAAINNPNQDVAELREYSRNTKIGKKDRINASLMADALERMNPVQKDEPPEEEISEEPPETQEDTPSGSTIEQNKVDANSSDLDMLIAKANDIQYGDEDSKLLEQKFNKDVDGINLFKEIANLGNGDPDALVNKLSRTRFGEEYGDKLTDILNAIDNYLYNNPDRQDALEREWRGQPAYDENKEFENFDDDVYNKMDKIGKDLEEASDKPLSDESIRNALDLFSMPINDFGYTLLETYAGNGYDIDDAIDYLKDDGTGNMSPLIDKYGERNLRDLLELVKDYDNALFDNSGSSLKKEAEQLGYMGPEVKKKRVKRASHHAKAMPSIEDLMDNEFTL